MTDAARPKHVKSPEVLARLANLASRHVHAQAAFDALPDCDAERERTVLVRIADAADVLLGYEIPNEPNSGLALALIQLEHALDAYREPHR